MQASWTFSAFRYLNGKKVPAEPPPDHHYGESSVAVVHDSGNQIPEWRHDVWAKSTEQPKHHTGGNNAKVLPLWNRKVHFFLQI